MLKRFANCAAGCLIAASFVVTDSAFVCAEDLATRPALLHEYTGKDSELAKYGVTLQQSITQFQGGVVDGGRPEGEGSHYSGRYDLLANIDGQKAGLWPGLFLKARVGANWHPIQRFGSGSILSPYTPGVLSKSDDPSIAVTDLSVVQMLSQNFGLTAGKVDVIDGDPNAFAGGRGTDQFENLAFVFNVVPSFAPLSTLGAGMFMLYDDTTPMASLLVLDTHNVPTKTGFDELFDNGVVLAASGEVPTAFGGLPGRHRFGATYTTADQIDLSQDPRFGLDDDGKFATKSDSWAVTYNAEQFLITDPDDSKKGWGLFARAGLSDPDRNIFHYVLSAGIGGSGVIPCRENDRFGVAYYHLAVSDLFEERLLNPGDEDGVEIFYSAALLPWLSLTGDLQFINPTARIADDAYVVSGRLQVRL